MSGTDGQRIKLALIGCGSRGMGVYAPALERYANAHGDLVELTAACDTLGERAEKVRRTFGFAVAVDQVAAATGDHTPNACLCVLPASDAKAQAAGLLAQGVPCLLELPVGHSIDAMAGLAEAARENGTPAMAALNRRFNPCLVRAARWARQLGAIRSVTCSLATDADVDAAYLTGTVVHAVDTLGHLLGGLDSYTLAPSDAGTVITLPFDDDATGIIAIANGASERVESYEITGDGFRAVATVEDAEGPSLRCWRGDTLEVDIAGGTGQPTTSADGAYDMLAEFIGGLSEGRKPSPSIDDALPAAKLTFRMAAERLQPAGA